MTILRLRVALLDIEPAIWRRVELSGSTTLKQLHGILQIVMGWENYHLHVFEAGKIRYGIRDRDDFTDQTLPEAKVEISEVLRRKGAKLMYWYDFGDDWYHRITLEAVSEPDPEVAYPRVLEGARGCPPEDCGGPFGYDRLFDVLNDPKHKEYEAMREWIGPNFNPEAFSIEAVNKKLRRNRSLAPKL